MVGDAGAKPVIVCVPMAMVTDAMTSRAAVELVSPAWLAVSVQVPVARMVAVAPLANALRALEAPHASDDHTGTTTKQLSRKVGNYFSTILPPTNGHWPLRLPLGENNFWIDTS